MKNIIFQAVQGAGKGTIAKMLVEKYHCVQISTGDLLRERRKQEDELAKAIANYQDIGILVPDEIVYQVFEERMSKSDINNGYILDGFPRNLEQAIKCDEILSKLNKENYIVINLTVPAEILIDRIVNRRTCDKCDRIYNLTFPDMKPKDSSKCDACGGQLLLRDDDSNIEAIKQRIQIYHDNAESLIDYYRKKGILYYVDSTQTKTAIAEVEKLIND